MIDIPVISRKTDMHARRVPLSRVRWATDRVDTVDEVSHSLLPPSPEVLQRVLSMTSFWWTVEVGWHMANYGAIE